MHTDTSGRCVDKMVLGNLSGRFLLGNHRGDIALMGHQISLGATTGNTEQSNPIKYQYRTCADTATLANNAVPDAAQDRFELTELFFHEDGLGYGFKDNNNPFHSPTGYGKSQVDFTQWELDRGVLHPVTGSKWWRAVNYQLMRDMLESHFINISDIKCSGSNVGVERWLQYLENPLPNTWYAAHNASIVIGYQNNRDLARQESLPERILMSSVITRVLLAQAMVDANIIVLSDLAKTDFFAVDAIVGVQYLYPANYPLRDGDVWSVITQYYVESVIWGGNYQAYEIEWHEIALLSTLQGLINTRDFADSIGLIDFLGIE